MKLERLGQLVKVKLPELQYVPDEELGLAYYNLKLRKPFPKPTTGGFLAPLRIWLLGKQDSWIEAQFQHDLREEEREHIALYAPLQRQQAEHLRQAQHHAETEQHLLTASQCKLAATAEVDLPTWYQIQLKREEHKLQLDTAQKMANIDIAKENDLMKMYIWVSRVERMFPKEIQVGLQERIFTQIDKVAEIQALPFSDARTAKLAAAEMLLNSWVRELDELTRGKKETVSGFNGAEAGRLDSAAEPPTSYPEDD